MSSFQFEGDLGGRSQVESRDGIILKAQSERDKMERDQFRETAGLSIQAREERVPEEVMKILETGTWPTVRAADHLYDTLWKEPFILLNTPSVDKLVKTEQYFRILRKVSSAQKVKEVVTVTID